MLGEAFRLHSARGWETELCAVDVGCLEVRSGPPDVHLFADGGMGRANGWIVDVEHPTIGEHPRLAPLVEFSRSSTVVKPSALCGAHTDAVLTELGYDAARIGALRDSGAIG